jgi:hypothetical protein
MAESIHPSTEPARAGAAACRFCAAPLVHTFVDLGMSPPCQTHIEPDQKNQMEPFYPLHAYVCDRCFLVQLEEYVAPTDIFSHYAYFSSYADSWVEHARRYALQMKQMLSLGERSFVVEVASNDGYLLQHFVSLEIPCRGIEPAANVAQTAVAKGIPTTVCFLGVDTARRFAAEHGPADLVLGNNVLAQVPDLNDFVGGLAVLLRSGGTLTIEFPHLLQLMDQNQFDTIYHEHFSYFSFYTACKIFAAHGLVLFDVEELPTHGGSLRIYGRHEDEPNARPLTARARALLDRELARGIDRVETYASFESQVKATKRKLLAFLVEAKNAGKKVVGYGAPGKGNTLLNYCGIREDFLDFTVDRNPHKQGRFTPGTRIPILAPEAIAEARPDYILLLPWNLREELSAQLAYTKAWGAKLVVPIPEVEIL